jgi:peptide/nickel transport system permease protein
MITFLVRRLLIGAGVMLGVSIITFLIAFAVPADPAVAMAGAKADPQTIAMIRKQLGLDQPLYAQYGRYLERALHGDLGRSYIRRQSVTALILQRFPATAVLAVSAMALALMLGLGMGIAASVWRGEVLDYAFLIVALAFVSIPVFWLGTMLLIGAAANVRSLPLGGFGNWRSLILPAITLALGSAGYSRGQAITRHALANALIPLVTLAGVDLAGLLSGVVLTETVFNWPGIGRLAFEAVFNLDIPLIMGTVLFGAALVIGANILVDLLYAWLDPRIRLSAIG